LYSYIFEESVLFPVKFSRLFVLLVGLVLPAGLMVGCSDIDSIRNAFNSLTPHEQYAASLRQTNLHDTALGRMWLDASERALNDDVDITLPFREISYLDPSYPHAISYRFGLQRGERLFIEVASQQNTATVFIDLFEVPEDTTRAPRQVASADSTQRLDYVARRSSTFILRIQPELLRGGRYITTLQKVGSLLFPVADGDSRDIGSVFGDPRDGGRRRHHGVDIFARRGTPVLAAADGNITRVRTGGLGGKTVWQRDRFGHSLYYAHLDSQMAKPNARVQAGDTLGLVGNTGNARATPPHLHFGIYSNGPVDPYPFIHNLHRRPDRVSADTSRLGFWGRTSQLQTQLRNAPDMRSHLLRTLSRHTTFFVLGGTDSWYRVTLPDGQSGFVEAQNIELAIRPLENIQLDSGYLVYNSPTDLSTSIDSLNSNTPVAVLGLFDDYMLVTSSEGRTGWIR